MKLTETFLLALKNILASKMRTLLTMLGIIIGVAAVIVIVGLGNGMETYMTESFQSMGTNLLTVNIMGRGNSSKTLKEEEAYSLVEDNQALLKNVSPTVNVSGNVKIGSEVLDETSITGVGEFYDEMKQYTMTSGRFLQYVDIEARKNVCVVGSYLDKEWFNGNSLGQEIRISGDLFRVVGVIEESGDSEEGEADDMVLIPYSNALKLSGTGRITTYSFEVASEDTVSEAKELIENKLQEIFSNTDSAYMIMSLAEMLDTMTSMLDMMVTVLAAIAAISLIVGGIGIMNIMLVSVSERTREIGIRKALGAKQKHIKSQFVIEATTTSAIGGLLGIAVGYGLSAIGTSIISMALDVDMSIIPSTQSVIMAFSISAFIGILFGYLPAKKAAGLNPIEALRYD